MTAMIDLTQNILSQNIICFETRIINKELINVHLDDASFGILDFKAVTAKETDETLEFIFVVDCSGSMSDICSDGRQKMQHIIHTLKNMILFFNDHPNIKLYVTVNAFDIKIYKIIERTTITNDNLNDLMSKIDSIKPEGSTNIELALINSAKNIDEIKNLYPTHIINHIFMTDGEANLGSNNIEQLQTYIVPNVSNIFIGFGIEHDATLLNGISSVGKSSYYFIDKLESAGLVYGEILHSIVYKLITDPEIIVKNGLVYDYKTNTWVNTLKICDIVSESNKIFNIVSVNPDECNIEIHGLHISDLKIIFPAIRTENTDLSTHLYRQRTLQLLYEVNEFTKKNRSDSTDNDLFNFSRINTIPNEERINIKSKLHNLICEIKNYMVENHLENDKILKNLCDDIYVCYRTFGTKYGNMFCAARQTSQGTQRIYTASSADDIDDRQPLFLRIPHRHYDSNIDLDNLPVLNHEVSHFADTPYLTPQSTQVIRSISDSTEDDDLTQKII